MRIISGKLKGLKLKQIKNVKIRPTKNLAKEGIFNFLETKILLKTKKILELFCGSGNISYEFASRGVKFIFCVDNNTHCIKYIKKTIKQLNLENNIFFKRRDVFSFLKKKSDISYDIIFSDPPYKISFKEIFLLIKRIIKYKWIKKNGLIIIESSKENSKKIIFVFKTNFCFKQLKYGNTYFSILFLKNYFSILF
ncbi:MAG: RsmD family RNA methyltransferase [Candidatus Karelsulcia muelleri]